MKWTCGCHLALLLAVVVVWGLPWWGWVHPNACPRVSPVLTTRRREPIERTKRAVSSVSTHPIITYIGSNTWIPPSEMRLYSPHDVRRYFLPQGKRRHVLFVGDTTAWQCYNYLTTVLQTDHDSISSSTLRKALVSDVGHSKDCEVVGTTNGTTTTTSSTLHSCRRTIDSRHVYDYKEVLCLQDVLEWTKTRSMEEQPPYWLVIVSVGRRDISSRPRHRQECRRRDDEEDVLLPNNSTTLLTEKCHQRLEETVKALHEWSDKMESTSSPRSVVWNTVGFTHPVMHGTVLEMADRARLIQRKLTQQGLYLVDHAHAMSHMAYGHDPRTTLERYTLWIQLLLHELVTKTTTTT